jgi:hypothetical protein
VDIGEPIRVIEVEPLEVPVPSSEPLEEPRPAPVEPNRGPLEPAEA